MKSKTILLIALLTLSNCSGIELDRKETSTLRESFSIKVTVDFPEKVVSEIDFISNQTIIGGELLTRTFRGREVDIVPQLSERMKFGNNLPETIKQLDWTYGIKPQVLV